MPNVLIVDDEPDSCEVVAQFLTRYGHTTYSAPNGRAALAQLVDHRPDAVVLDISMPEMNGITLLRLMRSYLRWQVIPVVVLTAHGTDEQLKEARELGACGIFQKSAFKLVDLLECLQKNLARDDGA